MLKKRMMILLIIYVLTFSLVGCGNVDMSVMGADSAEQALELFWECVRNEDVELAKKISFTYYIRFQKSGKEMFVTPTWNEYLNIVGYNWHDSPAVQTEEVINKYKGICENPDEWLEDYKVEDVEMLASYERRIYDLFGLNCVIQASLCYDYSYGGVNVIKIDNRWFVVSYSSWWDFYTYQ